MIIYFNIIYNYVLISLYSIKYLWKMTQNEKYYSFYILDYIIYSIIIRNYPKGPMQLYRRVI